MYTQYEFMLFIVIILELFLIPKTFRSQFYSLVLSQTPQTTDSPSINFVIGFPNLTKLLLKYITLWFTLPIKTLFYDLIL